MLIAQSQPPTPHHLETIEVRFTRNELGVLVRDGFMVGEFLREVTELDGTKGHKHQYMKVTIQNEPLEIPPIIRE